MSRDSEDPAVLQDGLAARLELASRATALKDTARAGWVLRGVSRPESVADHSFGTALLCLLFATDAGVDRDRSVGMAIVHDVAEAITGDIVARADPSDRTVSEAEKRRLEASAMADLVGGDIGSVMELWEEYEAASTMEALFVRDMNLLDMCLQATEYERAGRYDRETPIASTGRHAHLDEFFVSAGSRLSTAVGRALYEMARRRYEESRDGERGTSVRRAS